MEFDAKTNSLALEKEKKTRKVCFWPGWSGFDSEQLQEGNIILGR